ncbi:hypothetical protein SLEP1_g9427 [Rubroshorea leprosula]|uniref:AB hydrolase-1 domain-containing protein n=1 Tax=Rubroshorea leprosula TaxID=152421 RepID=A0AAV5IG37_9ROSI|nr:hypothetical protein SLEP1_g9427 [Rubroshorea leprosula]
MLALICNCTNFFATCTEMSFSFLTFLNCMQINLSYDYIFIQSLILDFLDEVVQKPTVLIGNSVGSLACVIAASESSRNLVHGLVLLNCAGGMNNKAIVDDWRIKLIFPLLLFIDFLLKQRRIASAIFERVRQRYSALLE